MSVRACVQCGYERDDGAALCPQHAQEPLDNWAEANRAICDWIHRGRPLRRLPADERLDSTASDERPFRRRYIARHIPS
jgi:hypothetical protein